MHPSPPSCSHQHSDAVGIKELLYRAETERLQQQANAAALAADKQRLTAEARRLSQQLAEAHAAVADSQQQLCQLSDVSARLQLQVRAATDEYRSNDIICLGLRDSITRLQQQLKESRDACAQQAWQIATFADDMADLRRCKADLGHELRALQQQHKELQAQHGTATQQLAQACEEMQDMRTRWLDEHTDQGRQLDAAQHQRRELEAQTAQLSEQLMQEREQTAAAHGRCAELEGELGRIRELVVLLGKAMGKQGQQLPSHDDPVWLVLGPLGGVAHALDAAIKHTREQQVRVREVQAAHDQLEDRVRSESAQKADLQAELYDVRTMYAKAVAMRDALEARTTRAEAEKAVAESVAQTAKSQAVDDAARLAELSAEVVSLTRQVQQLQPLQPKLSTTEAERDAALHKLERLQEQHDQQQRHLQQAVSREAATAAEVDHYKAEHSQLLAANAQLVEQRTALNQQLQVLEVNAREGAAAASQLEEARRKLHRTQTQLQAMADRHSETLGRLETTKELLATPSVLSVEGCGSPSARPMTSGSRPSSAWGRPSSRAPWQGSGNPGEAANSPRGSSGPGVQWADAGGRLAAPGAGTGSSAGDAGTSACAAEAGRRVTSTGTPGVAAQGAASASCGAACDALAPEAPSSSSSSRQHGANPDSIAAELDAMLHHKEMERLLASQQQAVAGLEDELRRQRQAASRLELQLLQQEAHHLQTLREREAAVACAWAAAAGDASAALSTALQDLRQVVEGPPPDDSAPGGPAADPSTAASILPLDGGSTCSSTAGSAQHHGEAARAQHDAEQRHQAPPASRRRWLWGTVQSMLAHMQAAVDDAQARAALVAARQHVGVQSDEPLQPQWLRYLAALPDAAVAQPLALKAAAEAVVRVYLRGLAQLEGLQQQGGPGGAAHAAVTPGVSVGGNQTLFDVLMAHYSSPQGAQQHHQGRAAVRPYNAALWQDPQGPITRLLVSCRSLAPCSTKLALFCCLAGTHAPQGSMGGPWGAAHLRQLLLLLHAIKRLTGGLWKAMLRDWSSAGGALLPLQCAADLLGNVYNAAGLAALERQRALLGSSQRLLDAVGAAASLPCNGAASPRSAGSRGGTRGSSRDAAPCASSAPVPACGSVAAALLELVVDGPLGPASAVDCDELLAMLMLQFDAGLLPPHPLLQPRRLTTGDLGNTTNAWGSAAAEAAAGAAPAGGRLQQLLLPLAPSSPTAADGSCLESGRSEWALLPSTTSGISSTGGAWQSRPTTGAVAGGGTSSRMHTAAAPARGARTGTASGLGGPQSPAGAGAAGAPAPAGGNGPGGLTLPRIRTPDEADAGVVNKQSTGVKKGLSMARVVAFEG